MTDPFATALAALHASPLAVAAVYAPAGGAGVPVRVIQRGPDRSSRYGDVQIYGGTYVIDVRKADVPAPAAGDRFVIGDLDLTITVDPVPDVEGLTWTCGCEVAA